MTRGWNRNVTNLAIGKVYQLVYTAASKKGIFGSRLGLWFYFCWFRSEVLGGVFANGILLEGAGSWRL